MREVDKVSLLVYIEDTDELAILDYQDEIELGGMFYRLETLKGKEYFSEKYFEEFIKKHLTVIGSL